MARTGTETRDDRAAKVDAAVTVPTPPTPEPAHRKPPRRRFQVSSVFKKLWVVLVIIAVVAITGFLVFRLREVFGKTETTRPGAGLVNDPAPFNPKRVKYEIFGVPGATATINYLDLDAQPQKAVDVALPWTLDLTTTAPAASPNIIAQGDGDTITCRITVDDVVKDERTVNGVNAQTFCLVKSA
jgi:hypothetical protein